MILIHSSSCFLIFPLPSFVGTSVKYIFPLISWKVSIHESQNKVQRICTMNFYIFFDFYISNMVNKNISIWILIMLFRSKFSISIISLKKQYVRFFMFIYLTLLLIFKLYYQYWFIFSFVLWNGNKQFCFAWYFIR